MNSDHQLLRKHIEQFLPLPDADWNLLLPHIGERALKKGEFFAEEGKAGREVGYVISGNMRHYYTTGGEERTTYFYFENMLVAAYISCITGQPSQLSIEALTDCKLLVFPYAALKKLFDQSLTWERFGRVLAEYLAIGLEARMAGLLMLSPEERYNELLNSNKKRILERIPQHYIANYLGITPVSLSRIRNRSAKK
jgi:CRP-like cAMP-binding protein